MSSGLLPAPAALLPRTHDVPALHHQEPLSPTCILHHRNTYIGCYNSIVVMPPTNDTGNDLEEKLVSIDRNLQDIRHDVAGILRSVQNELEAMREREFWRDYRETYQEE